MLLRIGCATRLVPSGLSHTDRKRSTRRQTQLRTVAEGRRPDQNPRSRKGASLENKKRRKGRPAWTRKPDDTPFRSEASVSLLVTKAGYQPGSFCRDGNRDRLVGLLTERYGYHRLLWTSGHCSSASGNNLCDDVQGSKNFMLLSV